MGKRITKFLLNYFYYFNLAFGLVVIKINVEEKRVTKSLPKIVYSILWMALVLTNYNYIGGKAFEGFDDIYYREVAVAAAISIEVATSYAVVVLIAWIR